MGGGADPGRAGAERGEARWVAGRGALEWAAWAARAARLGPVGSAWPGRLGSGSGPDGPPVLRHGDFSPDQVVLDGAGTGLLDLDEAVLGAPAADLGSFCAALARDAVCGQLDEYRAGIAADAFLDGYADAAGVVDEDAVRAWTAAAILRLAPEPFRHMKMILLLVSDWCCRLLLHN